LDSLDMPLAKSLEDNRVNNILDLYFEGKTFLAACKLIIQELLNR
jgi:hypothetical protein